MVLVASEGPQEEVDVNLVEVRAVVTGSDGQAVDDLRPEELWLELDGRSVELESVAFADDVPLSVGLLVDTSGSMQLLMTDTRRAAARFLGRTVLPGDHGFVVDFDERPRLLQPLTDDVVELLPKPRPDGS